MRTPPISAQPVLLRRAGKMTDPASVEEYLALDGFAALRRAMAMSRDDLLDEIQAANIRGRGGAHFPLDIKWRGLQANPEFPKYLVCNADESEPGTFKDRTLLQEDPLSVLEGMLIAAWLFNSEKSYIYIRGEYKVLQELFHRATLSAKAAGFLGPDILGEAGFNHDVAVISGSGAYICGENSALLSSIEGGVGRPRIKPSHEMGLYGKPTLVNNVETFACVTAAVRMGGPAFAALGTPGGGGTKLVSLSGHSKNRGVYEVPLGIPMREILYGEAYGGGTSTGRPVGFCHFGGQSGPIGFPEQLTGRYSVEDLREAGLAMGSGAIVVMDDSVDVVDYCRRVMAFFVHESCGRCTPCRIGTTRLLEMLDRFAGRGAEKGDAERLEALLGNVTRLSACGLGMAVGTALRSCLAQRRGLFETCCVETGA